MTSLNATKKLDFTYIKSINSVYQDPLNYNKIFTDTSNRTIISSESNLRKTFAILAILALLTSGNIFHLNGFVKGKMDIKANALDSTTATPPTSIASVIKKSSILEITRVPVNTGTSIGNSVDYDLVIKNVGPDVAVDPIIEEKLSSDLSHITSTPLSDSINPLVWKLDDIKVGESQTIKVQNIISSMSFDPLKLSPLSAKINGINCSTENEIATVVKLTCDYTIDELPLTPPVTTPITEPTPVTPKPTDPLPLTTTTAPIDPKVTIEPISTPIIPPITPIPNDNVNETIIVPAPIDTTTTPTPTPINTPVNTANEPIKTPIDSTTTPVTPIVTDTKIDPISSNVPAPTTPIIPPTTNSVDLVTTLMTNYNYPRIGDNINYIVTVGNKGKVEATDVVVKDIVPSGLEAIGESEFKIGTLKVNEYKSFTFIGKVTKEGLIENVATATSKEADTNPADNTGKSQVSVLNSTIPVPNTCTNCGNPTCTPTPSTTTTNGATSTMCGSCVANCNGTGGSPVYININATGGNSVNNNTITGGNNTNTNTANGGTATNTNTNTSTGGTSNSTSNGGNTNNSNGGGSNNGSGTVIDTDGDGIPNNIDTDDDNDGLTDDQEKQLGTNPLNVDTDFDGVSDGDEVKAETDPKNPNSKPPATDFDGDGIANDQDPDDDNDGISDVDEVKNGTNPLDVDSDNDGVKDGDEVKAGTNPNSASSNPLIISITNSTTPSGSVVNSNNNNSNNVTNIYGGGSSNTLQLDTDGDGIPNSSDTDDDNDGLPDSQEMILGLNPFNVDTDYDGVSDYDEVKAGTDPKNPNSKPPATDFDGDGIANDQDPDDDNDGISDVDEVKNGTNPLDVDSDNDGVKDGDEVKAGTNPNSATSNPTANTINSSAGGTMTINSNNPVNSNNTYNYINNYGGNNSVNPLTLDTDGDGQPNSTDVDDDNDGLPDTLEITLGTNPLNVDTDGDGVSDKDEIGAGTNPKDPNSKPPATDFDGDGIPNDQDPDDDNDGVSDVDEVKNGTNPLDVDSDNDGISDGQEIKIGTDPKNPNSNPTSNSMSNSSNTNGNGGVNITFNPVFNIGLPGTSGSTIIALDTDGDGIANDKDTDDDNDGLTDTQEMTLGTNPLMVDTDGDGVSDSDEVKAGTDPKNPNSKPPATDFDGDGIPNDQDQDDDNDGITDVDEVKNGTNPLDVDSDNDGIKDGDEVKAGSNPNSATSTPTSIISSTTNGSGVPNITINFSPIITNSGSNASANANGSTSTPISSIIDTDGDGIPNSTDTDDDNDGLSDTIEITLGLNTNNVDTDGDGVGDGDEVKAGTNPKDPNSKPPATDFDGDGIPNDQDLDDDNDGVSDVDEIKNGTNSLDVDSDNDGISDGQEIKVGTDPKNPNSNSTNTTTNTTITTGNPTTPNIVINGSNNTVTGTNTGTNSINTSGSTQPITINPSTLVDTDGDGIINSLDTDDDNDGVLDTVEITLGLNANNVDTDGDGVGDGDEIKAGTDPKNPNSKPPATDFDGDGIPNDQDLDDDNDGLSDVDEVKYGTNPLDVDTDNDGVKDGDEIKAGSDPKNPNSFPSTQVTLTNGGTTSTGSNGNTNTNTNNVNVNVYPNGNGGTNGGISNNAPIYYNPLLSSTPNATNPYTLIIPTQFSTITTINGIPVVNGQVTLPTGEIIKVGANGVLTLSGVSLTPVSLNVAGTMANGSTNTQTYIVQPTVNNPNPTSSAIPVYYFNPVLTSQPSTTNPYTITVPTQFSTIATINGLPVVNGQVTLPSGEIIKVGANGTLTINGSTVNPMNLSITGTPNTGYTGTQNYVIQPTYNPSNPSPVGNSIYYINPVLPTQPSTTNPYTITVPTQYSTITTINGLPVVNGQVILPSGEIIKVGANGVLTINGTTTNPLNLSITGTPTNGNTTNQTYVITPSVIPNIPNNTTNPIYYFNPILPTQPSVPNPYTITVPTQYSTISTINGLPVVNGQVTLPSGEIIKVGANGILTINGSTLNPLNLVLTGTPTNGITANQTYIVQPSVIPNNTNTTSYPTFYFNPVITNNPSTTNPYNITIPTQFSSINSINGIQVVNGQVILPTGEIIKVGPNGVLTINGTTVNPLNININGTLSNGTNTTYNYIVQPNLAPTNPTNSTNPIFYFNPLLSSSPSTTNPYSITVPTQFSAITSINGLPVINGQVTLPSGEIIKVGANGVLTISGTTLTPTNLLLIGTPTNGISGTQTYVIQPTVTNPNSSSNNNPTYYFNPIIPTTPSSTNPYNITVPTQFSTITSINGLPVVNGQVTLPSGEIIKVGANGVLTINGTTINPVNLNITGTLANGSTATQTYIVQPSVLPTVPTNSTYPVFYFNPILPSQPSITNPYTIIIPTQYNAINTINGLAVINGEVMLTTGEIIKVGLNGLLTINGTTLNPCNLTITGTPTSGLSATQIYIIQPSVIPNNPINNNNQTFYYNPTIPTTPSATNPYTATVPTQFSTITSINGLPVVNGQVTLPSGEIIKVGANGVLTINGTTINPVNLNITGTLANGSTATQTYIVQPTVTPSNPTNTTNPIYYFNPILPTQPSVANPYTITVPTQYSTISTINGLPVVNGQVTLPSGEIIKVGANGVLTINGATLNPLNLVLTGTPTNGISANQTYIVQPSVIPNNPTNNNSNQTFYYNPSIPSTPSATNPYTVTVPTQFSTITSINGLPVVNGQVTLPSGEIIKVGANGVLTINGTTINPVNLNINGTLANGSTATQTYIVQPTVASNNSGSTTHATYYLNPTLTSQPNPSNPYTITVPTQYSSITNINGIIPINGQVNLPTGEIVKIGANGVLTVTGISLNPTILNIVGTPVNGIPSNQTYVIQPNVINNTTNSTNPVYYYNPVLTATPSPSNPYTTTVPTQFSNIATINGIAVVNGQVTLPTGEIIKVGANGVLTISGTTLNPTNITIIGTPTNGNSPTQTYIIQPTVAPSSPTNSTNPTYYYNPVLPTQPSSTNPYTITIPTQYSEIKTINGIPVINGQVTLPTGEIIKVGANGLLTINGSTVNPLNLVLTGTPSNGISATQTYIVQPNVQTAPCKTDCPCTATYYFNPVLPTAPGPSAPYTIKVPTQFSTITSINGKTVIEGKVILPTGEIVTVGPNGVLTVNGTTLDPVNMSITGTLPNGSTANQTYIVQPTVQPNSPSNPAIPVYNISPIIPENPTPEKPYNIQVPTIFSSIRTINGMPVGVCSPQTPSYSSFEFTEESDLFLDQDMLSYDPISSTLNSASTCEITLPTGHVIKVNEDGSINVIGGDLKTLNIVLSGTLKDGKEGSAIYNIMPTVIPATSTSITHNVPLSTLPSKTNPYSINISSGVPIGSSITDINGIPFKNGKITLPTGEIITLNPDGSLNLIGNSLNPINLAVNYKNPNGSVGTVNHIIKPYMTTTNPTTTTFTPTVTNNSYTINPNLLAGSSITHINGYPVINGQVILPTGQIIKVNPDGTLTVTGNNVNNPLDLQLTYTNGGKTYTSNLIIKPISSPSGNNNNGGVNTGVNNNPNTNYPINNYTPRTGAPTAMIFSILSLILIGLVVNERNKRLIKVK
jgi:hypothetical protein